MRVPGRNERHMKLRCELDESRIDDILVGQVRMMLNLEVKTIPKDIQILLQYPLRVRARKNRLRNLPIQASRKGDDPFPRGCAATQNQPAAYSKIPLGARR